MGPATHYGICGPMGHLSEAAAVQRALQSIDDEFDAVISLGGESFTAYLLDGKRILTALSQSKCAAGSGEFFVQQIGRMGLGMDEAIERSFDGDLVPLAARCSVHCKSDITHKLNRNEASAEDILHTLHESMADKIAALLAQGQRESRRVLVIGGMARNRAMVAALRRRLAPSEVFVRAESGYLEALGAALLTRDTPKYRAPNITVKRSFGKLPPLARYGSMVQAIEPSRRHECGRGAFVLGVDPGSTTTKAVLLDPATAEIAASHYGRTLGDPVEATRRCLHAIVDQVGNRALGLVGITGSGRQIIGAYLGTAHVYNEICAHAVGAAHFDPGVDTIFEIGGQDAKYIHLRNGVPIDYAMNAACSAGTGSFLEECVQSDLDIPLEAIADAALRATSPVQFKATCAAFINSDIRTALLEGYSRDDIVAGVVYSVVNNYLTKVKGPRRVGGKICLQGGVARNRAVAHAFAHSVDRPVVIPPHPELLGAYGVALLAMRRGSVGDQATDLRRLADARMSRLGKFTCKACDLHCAVERFEVAGRRFPFGGRCGLFERTGRKGVRNEAADLVHDRARVIFAQLPVGDGDTKLLIGIPRALTSHSLFPLYSTFLAQLGLEVVLSDIDPRGELKAQSGFCFPVQIAHGALADLVGRGIDLIFSPHLVRMPNAGEDKDSLLCPIAQASPYFLAKAFPGVRLLSPVLDFTSGYSSNTALVDLAVNDLGLRPERAQAAYEAAVTAQLAAERSLGELGRQALAAAASEARPAVILVGRSYNAFTPEASQSVSKKLSIMGLTVIPADCLPAGKGGSPWHFANMILNAVECTKEHPHLFLVYVSNFSCTIDAFTHSMLAARLGSKPYLMLEIDGHTADAGVQTRLEAFVDIIDNYHEERRRKVRPAAPCKLGLDAVVTTSSGARIPLDDPRVKLYVPAFSDYHARAATMAIRWLGLNAGPEISLNRRQLDRGLLHTSGRECLPLPICVGQLLEVHERRAPGEVVGLYMLRGGAPCVVASYMEYFEQFIAEQQLHDTFMLNLEEGTQHGERILRRLGRYLIPLVSVADILIEIEQSLRVVGGPDAIERLRQLWHEFAHAASSVSEFYVRLPEFIDRIADIPRTGDSGSCPKVIVTGDFFTRFSPFFMEGVPELYAQHGVILKPVDLNDLVLYSLYDGLRGAACHWNLEAESPRTLARACTRVFRRDGRDYLSTWMRYRVMRKSESWLRRKFERSGLLVAAPNDTARLFAKASAHVSPHIYGETIPTVGKGLEADSEGYDGVVLIGPFNCLPYRVSEAILKPLCIQRGMPFLACESDGYGVSPAFLRQVDVHIQQVLERARTDSLVGSGATADRAIA